MKQVAKIYSMEKIYGYSQRFLFGKVNKKKEQWINQGDYRYLKMW